MCDQTWRLFYVMAMPLGAQIWSPQCTAPQLSESNPILVQNKNTELINSSYASLPLPIPVQYSAKIKQTDEVPIRYACVSQGCQG